MAMQIEKVVCASVALAAFTLLSIAVAQDVLADGKILPDVVFTDYADYAANPELFRRLLSPATTARLERESMRSGKAMATRPVNLAAERFIVYVPSPKPARGFGLLVFVPPWPEARLPDHWAAALDRHGVIFVSAARSGNDENAMGRRAPLALLAAQNIILRYPVDPQRVYIAGFSGGSRVALRLALGYPELFHGAILNAGSEPIGNAWIPLPPRDLLLQFQSSSHVIFVTGARDEAHIIDDMTSLRSMHRWCVFNVEGNTSPFAGHEVADSAALSRALRGLQSDMRPDPDRLAICRSAIDRELEEKFAKVQSSIASGRRADADQLLAAIDEHFGGLAAPRSSEFRRQ